MILLAVLFQANSIMLDTLSFQPLGVLIIMQSLKRYSVPIVALLLLCVSAGFWLLRYNKLANWTLFIIVIWGAIPLLWDIIKSLGHKKFSVDIIAAMAIIVSLFQAEYFAGAIVVVMLSGGKTLEAYALRRANSSLSKLVERVPRITHIWYENQLVDIPVEKIQPGMVIVVKPGEVIPVDGVIVRGTASISQSDLTGESLPVYKTVGMGIMSGCVNLDGIVDVQASKASAESKFAQIVHLVAEAQKQKAPIHRLADRYSIIFTVLTIILAVTVWRVLGNHTYALAVLVVATPCPLIVATPIAIMSGINNAARHGIVVKSGAAIEQLGNIDIAVFDKTGTLTMGMPEVSSILLSQEGQQDKRYTEEEILGYAASVEQLSGHILATAIVSAAMERQYTFYIANSFEEMFGRGVCANLTIKQDKQIQVAVGNRTFMRTLHILVPDSLLTERERRRDLGQICSFVAVDNKVEGLIIMEDVPRPEIRQLCSALKKEGIKQTILLTGDSETVAHLVGSIAKVDHVIARCLPEDKVRVVQNLELAGHKVLMVGDGINDAPALATATVGMALGAQGLTGAASAADTVLLSTNILGVLTAVILGCRVIRIARQGIWLGMGLSIVAMLFAAFGYISPSGGAILQEGIDIIVICNALRVSILHYCA